MTSHCERVDEQHHVSGSEVVSAACVKDDGTGGDALAGFITNAQLSAECRACPTCACVLAAVTVESGQGGGGGIECCDDGMGGVRLTASYSEH
jgi:hypothetical protein